MDRKMIKWKPFNTLIKYKDIIDVDKKRNNNNEINLMEDKIKEINDILINSNNKIVKVKYYNKGNLLYKEGIINKINTIEKYILIENTRIHFKNIINVEFI